MLKDNRGRQITKPFEIRGAHVTAVASLTTGTAATLLSGDASYFLDLIQVSLANSSTVSASVSLTSDGTTLRTYQIPAGDTLVINYNIPISQLTKNVPWLVDMEDITGTTVTVEAEFIKN